MNQDLKNTISDTVKIRALVLINNLEEGQKIKSMIEESKIGLELTIANDLNHFISMTSQDHFDCFILDWKYEKYAVVDLVNKIRRSSKYKKASIIYLTDQIDAMTPQKYPGAEDDLVITRPLQKEELLNICLSAVEKTLKRIIPEHYEVLMVDDNSEILEMMKSHMEELKHQKYQICTSIRETKKLLQEKDYDLLLLDWNLEDGTCIDVIDFLRSKKEKKQIKEPLIVVITGRDDVEDIMTLLRYNINDHIIKPFDFQEFEEKLSYAIEKYNK